MSTFCSVCGKKIETHDHFCKHCGTNKDAPSKPLQSSSSSFAISSKSGLATFLLCLFLGSLGVHRFYVGKIGTGILMLLTSGGFGIWYLYDLITIVCNNFTDKKGNRIEITRNPSTPKTIAFVVGSIAAAFLIFFVCIFLVVWLFISNLADVAQNQLTALRASDYEKAYSYTSSDFKNEITLEDFEKFITANPVLKDNISASFPQREMNNQYGTIRGTLLLENGQKIPIEFQFIKEDNDWKIMYIDLKYQSNDNDTSTNDAT